MEFHQARQDDEQSDAETYAASRRSMVETIREMAQETDDYARGGVSENVLAVMQRVPRHRFVPADQLSSAYFNQALPIGHDQTISQPYIVALVAELLQPGKHDTVLEIGTGSGYQAAVLAELAGQVYSVEIVAPLAVSAEKLLRSLGYDNIAVRHGDGTQGWPQHAPFDCITVAAATPHVPPALLAQLKPGGRLVIPLGGWSYAQQLMLLTKDRDGVMHNEAIIPVRFVPLTGGDA